MRRWYRFCRIWCRAYVGGLHFGRVFNQHLVPAEGPILVVSNHQSFFDPVLVGYGLSRELDYMARDTLFRNPFFERLIRSLNAFPVRRGEVDVSAIKETLRRLKAGRAVLLFPEGTRTVDGRIHEFKPGLAMLARKAAVPVVPAVIDGAFEAWPRKSPVPRPLAPIHVYFGQPWTPEQIRSTEPEILVQQLHTQMVNMQHHVRQMAGRKPYNYTT
ncbi:MAG: 1-acyl-sn-glycerol-3-phosphate acyltransferase [Phycisphaerae bacterium]|nr:1-acyl-sn-glycerol-3-phosphate acyltransferase [Phycisphaerae bacterium]